ncbi:RcpC/CpaB family pilus assembly protein [Streptomyces sp. KE1]|uniref:RcpC/CpaB family pilus assembly protein n=1 Tax=Streptomyces sp. KE1 TaxID=1638939 RepID=UPI001F253815|nr:RcpC/CpaB family pilus assembly protein [Streptomyces sp. KE1]
MAGLLVGAVWWAVPGVQASRDAPGGEAVGGSTASERVEVAGAGARTGAGSAAGRFVTAPVRLADGGAAGLLRAGDRVDVLAPAQDRAGGGRGHQARRIASCAEVLRVPGAAVPDGQREAGPSEEGAAGEASWPEFGDPDGSRQGLVLLRVRRATAEALAGAAMGVPAASGTGSGAHLVVTVC